MKNFVLGITVFLIICLNSCHYSSSQPVKMLTPCPKFAYEEPVAIIFEHEFNEDTLKVFVDRDPIFSGIISTDHSTGQAATVFIDTRKRKKITIYLNNRPYILPKPCKKIIVISYLDDTMYVELMDKPRMYY